MSLIILLLTCFTLLIITIYQHWKYKKTIIEHSKRIFKFTLALDCFENVIDIKNRRINNLIKINQSTNTIKNNKLKATERDHKKLKQWVNNIKLPH